MTQTKMLRALAAAGLLCTAMAGVPAQAQSDAARATTAPGALSPADKLSRADQAMLRDIAQANLAEIATGKLALEKSQDGEVKKFAQMMVDDHSTALKDVQQLAQAKAVTLPTEPDTKHKAAMKAMQAMDGARFDRQYMSQAGVGDHRKTRELLQKTQARTKDGDLKALAGKMLPVVEQHLSHAERMAKK
jgi:putative membrane protein